MGGNRLLLIIEKKILDVEILDSKKIQKYKKHKINIPDIEKKILTIEIPIIEKIIPIFENPTRPLATAPPRGREAGEAVHHRAECNTSKRISRTVRPLWAACPKEWLKVTLGGISGHPDKGVQEVYTT